MRSNNNLRFLTAIALMVLLFSCKKDDVEPGLDVVYAVNVDGYTATFTNQTTGGQSYKWDFGDGTTSTDQSPVHTYPGKGKYVPTLYVTAANGQVTEGSTVLRIAKSTSVKLDDNSFSDWDTVSHNAINSGAGAGIFKKAKYDYDGNYVYFYFELQSAEANADIFDFYVDTDNSPGTGFISWMFPGGGFDVLLEGQIFAGWFEMYYHNGPQTAFAWAFQTGSGFCDIGTKQQDGNLFKFEGRLSRSKIRGLTGTAFKIGVAITKNDWSATIGNAPDITTQAFFIDMAD